MEKMLEAAPTRIRTVEIGSLKIGDDSSFSFMSEKNNRFHPFFALEVPVILNDGFPKMFCEKGEDLLSRFKGAQSSLCDLICVKFNLEEGANIEPYKKELEKILEIAQKPLIIRGSGDKNFDKTLLKELALTAKKPCIIAPVQDLNYEDILPAVIQNNHIAILRTPIDINLTKELNILANDAGLPLDRILIDPDMGALGYGLDYGYSIIERIKIAGFSGDKMLNMPVVVFAGEEVYKAKEAKSDDFEPSWGELEKRYLMWEVSTASAVVSAGANVVVLLNPQTIKIIKGVL